MADVAIIGQGYVGLPLAQEASRVGVKVLGFDINQARIAELREGRDGTLEVEPELLAEATRLTYASDADGIAD